MTMTLGLDLGTNSLDCALIGENRIIDLGTIIFSAAAAGQIARAALGPAG